MVSFFCRFRRFPLWPAVLGTSAAIATLVQAQGYNISWAKIAGGGGTSTGGGFILNGTIGQHDGSAQLSGGQYKLAGGFWPGIGLVQTPGAPLLTIANTGPKVDEVHPLIIEGQGHTALTAVEAFSGPNGALTTLNQSQDFLLVRGEKKLTVRCWFFMICLELPWNSHPGFCADI